MLPNYHVNSLVLVNKTAYGVRSPLTGKELSQGRYPQKGSTVISRFPLNPDIMYIKRVLGLPGDIISLDEKGLKINNIPYPFEFIEQKAFGKDQVLHDVYQVTIDDNSFKVIVSLEKEFPVIKEEKVEQGTFFLLGDNLTGSSDSRTFGGVPWHYLVGKVL
jgi:signal peptidase I